MLSHYFGETSRDYKSKLKTAHDKYQSSPQLLILTSSTVQWVHHYKCILVDKSIFICR